MGASLADLPVPTADPEEVRRLVADILAAPEFVQAQPPWWRRALSAGLDLLERIVSALAAGGRGSVVGTLVLLGACAVVAFVAVRFIRRVQRDPAAGGALGDRVGRSPEQWRADADAAERDGRRREAVRCLYRAVLSQLAADGLLDEVPGRTAGEYLAAVRADVPAAADAFEHVTRAFEATWYGHREPGPEDVAAFRRDVERVTAAVGGRMPVGAAP